MTCGSRIGIIGIVTLGAVCSAWGLEYYVATNGAHQAPFTNWARASTNIKTAVDCANTNDAGDTVWVSNGVYVLQEEVAVSNTWVISWQTNRETTIVDGGNYAGRPTTNRCFYLNHSNAFLAGFTISNGSTTGTGYGGGVKIDSGGGMVSNCVITRNYGNRGGGVNMPTGMLCASVISYNTASSGNQGGGIYATGGQVLYSACIRNCLVISNSASYGAGMSLYHAMATQCVIVGNNGWTGNGLYLGYSSGIFNSQISSNTGGGSGNGIYVINSARPGGTIVSQCVIEANTGPSCIYVRKVQTHCIVDHTTIRRNSGIGVNIMCNDTYLRNCLISGNGNGGIYIGTNIANGEVRSCTIASNTANRGAGMWVDYSNSIGRVRNCIIYGNTLTNTFPGEEDIYVTVDYSTNMFAYCCASNYGAFAPSAGNINSDPRFLSVTNGNYQLGSGSPCIDTGTNEAWMTNGLDLDGRSRIFHRRVDMGAYEYRFRGTIVSFH